MRLWLEPKPAKYTMVRDRILSPRQTEIHHALLLIYKTEPLDKPITEVINYYIFIIKKNTPCSQLHCIYSSF